MQTLEEAWAQLKSLALTWADEVSTEAEQAAAWDHFLAAVREFGKAAALEGCYAEGAAEKRKVLAGIDALGKDASDE